MLPGSDYTALKDGDRAHPLEPGSNMHNQKGTQFTLVEDGLLATILLHRTGGVHESRMGEATFLAGRPAHSAVPALVWGGLHASLGPLSRRVLYWRMTYGTFYWTGFMLFLIGIGNHSPDTFWIAMPLIFIYNLATCVPWMPPSSSGLQQSTELILQEEVNPILDKLGYWVEYRAEPTGALQRTDNRLYVKSVTSSP